MCRSWINSIFNTCHLLLSASQWIFYTLISLAERCKCRDCPRHENPRGVDPQPNVSAAVTGALAGVNQTASARMKAIFVDLRALPRPDQRDVVGVLQHLWWTPAVWLTDAQGNVCRSSATTLHTGVFEAMMEKGESENCSQTNMTRQPRQLGVQQTDERNSSQLLHTCSYLTEQTGCCTFSFIKMVFFQPTRRNPQQ